MSFNRPFFSILLFVCTILPMASYGQKCISHRAHVSGLPENSIEGLRTVKDRQWAGVEFDIQITKEGEPILYHDSRLGEELEGAYCPRGEKIKDLSYDVIQRECFLTNGEVVPHLTDALDVLEGFKGLLFIDLKKKGSERFYRIIEKSWVYESPSVRFLSFKKRALRPLKRRWKRAKTILLSRYIPRGLFYDGVGFNNRLSFFSGIFKFLGKKTSLWTLNEREQIEKAIKKEVSFIITDHYELCKNLLQN